MLSPLAARKAEKLGYKNIKVFHAGLPAWKKPNNLVTSNVDALKRYRTEDLSYVLLDLRPDAQVQKGHIPNAVAVSPDGIAAMKEELPRYKGAQIILYNEDGNLASAEKIFKDIRGWDFKNVSVLSGGFAGWKNAKETIATGPAGTKIAYVRKLLPGEFEVTALEALVKKPKDEVLVVDVRAPKETKDGVLPRAKAIPLDELESRLSELPKEKMIVAHCSTGARAEMAYNILKKAGYNVKYVKAKVDFDKEKKPEYSITE